ncbi:MAG: DUF4058 family protein [Planctomycetes bacterium]|nr:DUF4058 family protein [Planctomycetota bacterium]
MPSPFPGMDPYLEAPHRWPNVHLGLIAEIQVVLSRLVRPRYFVRVEERVYISDEADPGRKVIVPDLRVLPPERRSPGGSPGPQGSTTVVVEPIVVTTLIDEEIRESYLEVIDAESRETVTFIEVLSPVNKVAGARGRASYMQKRQEVLRSKAHWVEVDFLRSGEPLVAAEVLPLGDYFVHVSRAESRPKGFVGPIRLEQRLPPVRVPLRGPDENVVLDLQPIFISVYDRSGYDLDIDYRGDPNPPLTAAQGDWAARVLKAKGLR